MKRPNSASNNPHLLYNNSQSKVSIPPDCLPNLDNYSQKNNDEVYEEELNLLQIAWNELGITQEYRQVFINHLKEANDSEKNNIFSEEKNNIKKFKDSLLSLKKEIENREKNLTQLKKLNMLILNNIGNEGDTNNINQILQNAISLIKNLRINAVNIVKKMIKVNQIIAYYTTSGKFNINKLKPEYSFDPGYLLKMKEDLKFLKNSALSNYIEMNNTKIDPFLTNCAPNINGKKGNKIEINIADDIMKLITQSRYYLLQETVKSSFEKDNNYSKNNDINYKGSDYYDNNLILTNQININNNNINENIINQIEKDKFKYKLAYCNSFKNGKQNKFRGNFMHSTRGQNISRYLHNLKNSNKVNYNNYFYVKRNDTPLIRKKGGLGGKIIKHNYNKKNKIIIMHEEIESLKHDQFMKRLGNIKNFDNNSYGNFKEAEKNDENNILTENIEELKNEIKELKMRLKNSEIKSNNEKELKENLENKNKEINLKIKEYQNELEKLNQNKKKKENELNNKIQALLKENQILKNKNSNDLIEKVKDLEDKLLKEEDSRKNAEKIIENLEKNLKEEIIAKEKIYLDKDEEKKILEKEHIKLKEDLKSLEESKKEKEEENLKIREQKNIIDKEKLNLKNELDKIKEELKKYKAQNEKLQNEVNELKDNKKELINLDRQENIYNNVKENKDNIKENNSQNEINNEIKDNEQNRNKDLNEAPINLNVGNNLLSLEDQIKYQNGKETDRKENNNNNRIEEIISDKQFDINDDKKNSLLNLNYTNSINKNEEKDNLRNKNPNNVIKNNIQNSVENNFSSNETKTSDYTIEYYHDNLFNLLEELNETIPLEEMPDFLKRAFAINDSVFAQNFYFKGIFPKIIVSKSIKENSKITGMCSFYYESTENLNENLTLRINTILVGQNYEEQIIQMINFIKKKVECDKIMVYVLYDKVGDKFITNSEAKNIFQNRLHFKWFCVVRDEKSNQRYIKYAFSKKEENYDPTKNETTMQNNALKNNKNNFLMTNIMINSIIPAQDISEIKNKFLNKFTYNKFMNPNLIYITLIQNKTIKSDFHDVKKLEEINKTCEKIMKYMNIQINYGKEQIEEMKHIEEEIENSIYKEINLYLMQKNIFNYAPNFLRTNLSINFETNYSMIIDNVYFNRISSDKISVFVEEKSRAKFFLIPSKDNNTLFYISEINPILKDLLIDGNKNIYEKFLEFQPSAQKQIFEYSVKSIRDISYVPLTQRNASKTLYIPCFSIKTHLFSYDFKDVNKNMEMKDAQTNKPLKLTSVEEFINVEFNPDKNIQNSFSTVEDYDYIIKNSFIMGIFDNDIINNTKLPLLQFLYVTKDHFLTKNNNL